MSTAATATTSSRPSLERDDQALAFALTEMVRENRADIGQERRYPAPPLAARAAGFLSHRASSARLRSRAVLRHRPSSTKSATVPPSTRGIATTQSGRFANHERLPLRSLPSRPIVPRSPEVRPSLSPASARAMGKPLVHEQAVSSALGRVGPGLRACSPRGRRRSEGHTEELAKAPGLSHPRTGALERADVWLESRLDLGTHDHVRVDSPLRHLDEVTTRKMTVGPIVLRLASSASTRLRRVDLRDPRQRAEPPRRWSRTTGALGDRRGGRRRKTNALRRVARYRFVATTKRSAGRAHQLVTPPDARQAARALARGIRMRSRRSVVGSSWAAMSSPHVANDGWVR